MIKQSKYLPKQMTGPVLNSFMEGVEDRMHDAKAIEDYLYGLSIMTAQETELENIGRIIGYPRPLVPEGFEQENVFVFTRLPMVQDELNGFSKVNKERGGRLTSTTISQSNYMSLGLYRTFLPKVAYIKRYGVTLYSVDQIARLIDDEYTIGWDEKKDITLAFAKDIGFKNIWLLSNLFYKFATSPQVIITTGEEE